MARSRNTVQIDRIFTRVYDLTSRTIRELADPMLKGMEELGYGRRANGHQLREKFLPAIESLLFRPMDEPPYAAMTIRGAQEKRRAALEELFMGLGVEKGTAGRYADSLVAMRANYRDDGTRLPLTEENFDTNRPLAIVMRHWWPVILRRGQGVYQKLQEIKEDASKPYKGTPRDPDDGVEQTVDLLRRFPAIANYIYQQTSLPGLHTFPPEPTGSSETDSHIFATEVQEHLDGEWWQSMLFGAGLAILCIVVTVGSFGTLGPVAAAALGIGLGTAQGGVLVFQRSQAVGEARIAVQMGAMDEETLRGLENSLEGAWAMLVVDVASGGLMGKFGGRTIVSSLLRGTAISGAGGGLGTALDPNVWEDENRVAIILQGVLITGVAGAVGSGVGAGLSTLARPGSPVQVLFRRGRGPLAANSEVEVSFARDATPVRGTVESVGAGGSVRIKVQGQEVAVRVERTIGIDADTAPATARPLPVAPDSAPRRMGYVLDSQSGQVRGTVTSRTSNDGLIGAAPHSNPGEALAGYPGLSDAVRKLDVAGNTHRLVEIDGATAVQVLRPAAGKVHASDVVQHDGGEYYATHVLRPESGGSGVEVMPVSTRRTVSGVRGTDFTPMTPTTADTQRLMLAARPGTARSNSLLQQRIVHHREMGPLSGYAEHVVRERVVPNNLVAGASPAYQRAVIDQYNDGATFIFVSDWKSKRFFSWPSGTGTVRLDGSSHVRSTVGSSRAHMDTATDMGRLTGVGGRAPVTESAPAGSGQAAYNDFVGGTMQFKGGRLYWSDKSDSINELISKHGRNDGRFFDDMHPEMTKRLQEWFGLRADQIEYVGSSRNFPFNSRPGQ